MTIRKFLTIFLILNISQKTFSISVLSSKKNTAYMSFPLNRFDADLNECQTIREFTYPAESNLEMIYLNTDQSTDYKWLTGLENSKNSMFVAVKDSVELVLIIFTDSKNFKEYTLNTFSNKIILVEPFWFFGRVYVLTYYDSDMLVTAYEIDINLQAISTLFSFKSHSDISMLPDPFQGTLTFNFDNKIVAINILYLKNYMKNHSVIETLSLEEYAYDNYYMEFGVCNDFSRLNFLTTSSQIDGYSKLQTYYLITNLNEYLECFVYDKECNCVAVNNQTIIESIQKIYKFNSNENACHKTRIDDQENISLQTLNVYVDPTIHDQALKSCSRICSLPEWKTKLYDKINTGPHSWNKISLNTNNKYSCTNTLQIDESFEAFGYNRLSNQTDANNSLQVQFNKKLMAQLMSEECWNLEMTYKYIVSYREVYLLEDLNLPDNFEYQMEAEVDSSVFLTLKHGSSYEVNIQIQTPFDAVPYQIGSYLIQKYIETNIIEPDYKRLEVRKLPFILDDYWSQIITDTAITVTLLVNADAENVNLKNLRNMSYILTNMGSNDATIENILFNDQPQINYFHLDLNFYKISFKIDDLMEDAIYRLRVFNSNEDGQVASLSNIISFRTLQRPMVRVLSHDSKNNIVLEIKIRCRFTVNDLTTTGLPKYKDDSSHFNICNYFSIYMSESDTNATDSNNWTMVYHEQIFSNQKLERVDLEDEENIYSMDYVKNMTVSNFSFSTHYSLSLSINYYTNNLTLNSDVIDFYTYEDIVSIPRHSNSLYVFLIILCSLVGIIFAFGILTGFRKKRILKLLQALGLRKNNLFLDDAEFIDKMTHMNMLYSWTSHKKLLVEKLDKLTKFDLSQITIVRNIGKGTFGEVFEGILKFNETFELPVAVKKLKPEAADVEKFDLIKEAIALSSFNHSNLIKFYGVCMDQENPNYLILEYMKLGDLLTYLRSIRKLMNFNIKKALKISIDIAKGCEFLEQNKMVHRDIAARNCLVTSIDENVSGRSDFNIIVKIGDFGLAREMYVSDYYKQSGDRLLPIRWMSPEAIFDGVFTTQSDIWSFGITLWEIMTLGRQPYPGIDNKQVIDTVKNGGVPQIPEKCPLEVTNIMNKCWSEFNSRPSFRIILSSLQSIYKSSSFNSESISIYNDMRPLNPNKKSKNSSSSSPNEYDDELFSRYTSGTSATMLTNTSSISMPMSSNKLNFIEKYTDEDFCQNAEPTTEGSQLLSRAVDSIDVKFSSNCQVSKL